MQEILETARVEEVVGDFVNLKRRGVNLIGLCPFHNEKTPSFTVSPGKNIYKCFGCGKAGDPAKFLMEHESYTFPEALRYLAKKYGLEIEEEVRTEEDEEAQRVEDSLFILNDFAKKHYAGQLFETDTGKSVGLRYFKDRGFREETIRKFDLGFAPNQRDVFTQKARDAGFEPEYLRQLGLTTEHGRDFFRDRVMFTIHNLTGKPVAFAGRILNSTAKAPKYINSPESEIYHKSRILYGAYFAQRAMRQQDECILVEGYTDVISLHQGGIENVVASSGTSLTVEQVRLIRRFTPNIKILYDGDEAGKKAALRGLDIALEQDMNVRVVLLPEKEDPDSYLQQVGATAFQEYIEEQSKDFILFKTQVLATDAGADPVRKTALIKDIVASIALIPDPIKRSLYIKECASIVEVGEEVLINELNAQVRRLLGKRRQEKEREERAAQRQEDHEAVETQTVEKPKVATSSELVRHRYEREIARILIASGGQIFDKEEQITVAEFILSHIEEELAAFESPIYRKVAELCLDLLLDKTPLSTNYFLQHEEESIRNLAIELIHSPYEFSPGWEEREIYLTTQKAPELNYVQESVEAVDRLKYEKIEKLMEQNQQLLQEARSETAPEEILRRMKIHHKLLEQKALLAKRLGMVVGPRKG